MVHTVSFPSKSVKRSFKTSKKKTKKQSREGELKRTKTLCGKFFKAENVEKHEKTCIVCIGVRDRYK